MENDHIESVWLQIKLNGKTVLYGTFYVPPGSSNDIWDLVDDSIESAVNDNRADYIIVTGDFNDNQLNMNFNSKIRNISTRYSLSQLIDEPTNYTEHSASLIDLILTNDVNFIPYTAVGPSLTDQIRYHCPIVGFMNIPKPKNATSKRKIWLYNQGNYDEYRYILADTDRNSVFDSDDIDVISSRISHKVLNAAEATIPNRMVTIRKRDPAWFERDLKHIIQQKNRIYRKAKRTNRPRDWAKFRKLRNKVTSKTRYARKDYDDNLLNKLSNAPPSSKTWWKICKHISGLKSSFTTIPPLLHDNELIFDDIDKANAFNDFFVSQTQLNDSNTRLPNLTANDHLLQNIEISENDVEDILKCLDTSKATGPDLISPRVLKEASSVLKYPLCRLFNLSLSTATFPSDWKQAHVSPVFKNGNPGEVKNYRPISLLSIISKCMERCVYKYIHNFLLVNNVITPHQSGFTRGDSAINQLVYITNEFGRALDNGKEIRVVFCDISKAFDRVWHKGLLFKLEKYGISGNLLNWVKNYLSDRRQRVVLNGKSRTGWK